MADDKTKRGTADRAKVNASESYEVGYEAKKTGAPRSAVRSAVGKAGNARGKVEEALKKTR